MTMDHLPRREFELLSAYLDGELKPREARKVEARLRTDARWQREYNALKALVTTTHGLPQYKPPRSFILTPEMVGLRERPRGYPVLRLATALATFAFIAVLGFDLISSSAMGAAPMRALEQEMGEAPAAPEMEMLDAAKSEVSELQAEAQEVPEDEIVGEEALAEEEPAEEALAFAEPAAEGEGLTEERAVGEADAAEEAPLLEPTLVPPEEGEAALAYSATEAPEADALANLADPDVESSQDIPVSVSRPSAIPWIRVIEVGLGSLALLLGVLALWVRRRSR